MNNVRKKVKVKAYIVEMHLIHVDVLFIHRGFTKTYAWMYIMSQSYGTRSD